MATVQTSRPRSQSSSQGADISDDIGDVNISIATQTPVNAGTPPQDGSQPSNANRTNQGRNQPPSAEEKHLRLLLKLFFYRPAKWENGTLHIHTIYLIFAILQIIKVGLVTSQARHYGNDRAHFNSVVHRGHLAVRHLLLKGWDASWETNLSPRASHYYTVYTTDSLEEDINFVVEQYYNVERNAIGYYKRLHNDSMQVVVKYFNFPDSNDTGVEKDVIINEKHFTIEHGLSSQIKNETVYGYSIADELEFLNSSQILTRLLVATIKFTLQSVKPNEDSKHALCLQIDGTVTFQDVDNIGQVQVDLDTHTKRLNCRTMNISVKDLKLESTSNLLSETVKRLCISSIVISVITCFFGLYVCWKTLSFMKRNYNIYFEIRNDAEAGLPCREYLRFLRHVLWDFLVIISDSFTLRGTVQVFFTEDRVLDVKLLDDYTMLLGVGCILAWMSLLRYFNIHRKFYILFRTVYRAFVDALAYLLCASVLFIGFWLCGFIVLGPYNNKFQKQSSAAETLFALVNGDEIYATMAMLDDKQIDNEGIQVFASIYLVVYVCTFTIVAINLLVTLFLNAYEEIKTKPKDRKLGLLENAIQDVIKNPDGKQLQPFRDLLSPAGRNSPEEEILRRELSKIIKINETDNTLLENVKSISLKSFIRVRDENDTRCRFLLFFHLKFGALCCK